MQALTLNEIVANSVMASALELAEKSANMKDFIQGVHSVCTFDNQWSCIRPVVIEPGSMWLGISTRKGTVIIKKGGGILRPKGYYWVSGPKEYKELFSGGGELSPREFMDLVRYL